jgi:hypothetical protein
MHGGAGVFACVFPVSRREAQHFHCEMFQKYDITFCWAFLALTSRNAASKEQ